MEPAVLVDPKIGGFQFQAFVSRVSHSMVFALHVDRGRAGNGTAVMVDFGEYTYIVSALHVFTFQGNTLDEITRTWNQTRFKFHDDSPISFHDSLNIPEEELVLIRGIGMPAHRPPLISKRFDLIAVRVQRDEIVSDYAFPIDLRRCLYSAEIKSGASLITVGMPYDGRNKRACGRTVFYPHTEHVRHEPAIGVSGLSFPNKREDNLFFHYMNRLDGIHPGGFSGAPVWANYDSEGDLWAPNPAVVGIMQEYYPKSKILRAVRIQHLVDLLQTDTTT